MIKNIFIVLIALHFSVGAISQDYFPTNSGVKTKDKTYKAFTNATIYVSPTQVIEKGTLLIRDDKVISVGANVSLPSNTQVYDLEEAFIYPSFIEIYSDFGIQKPKPYSARGRSAQYEASREGYYWNDHILSDYNSINDYRYNSKKAESLRAIGFGVVNAHRPEGIHRGTSVLIALNDNTTDNKRILSDKGAQHLSFSKSKISGQSYPTSIMGAMALIRQFYHDSKWYKNGGSNSKDLAIESYLKIEKLPIIFDASTDKLNPMRAAKIAKEFNKPYIIVGTGNEYQYLHSFKKNKPTLILPLNFPKAYDVSDPLFAKKITINQMRHWDQAPSNPAILAKASVPFALTTHKLDKKNNFLKNIRKSIKRGLTEEQALKSLTITPAKQLGKSKTLGSLDKGKQANFLITSGPIFDEKTKIYENWVQGKPHVLNDRNVLDINGYYSLSLNNTKYSLKIENSNKKIKVSVKEDSLKLNTKVKYKDNWLQITFSKSDSVATYLSQLSARVDNSDLIKGTGVDFEGKNINWYINKDSVLVDTKKEKKLEITKPLTTITFPNNGYGFKKLPTSKTYLFKNATVWTNESDGILKNTDVLVKDGKIAQIGASITSSDAEIIDATGKHLTSGIIDEHSHIAASSINEAGQNSSAEVTIEDAIDPEHIGIYRNLAGGVTTIQILHGSANPIGGQSAIIKLKWGQSASDLIYPNADKFIKFALGENVKQSNWQSFSRFPQTRMGVEQVFVDYFQRAKEYDILKKKVEALKKKQKKLSSKEKEIIKSFRYDLEMESLVDILQGKRFISCHSYVQSEINMLMKVADRFGFTVNTFTHILEGYKVADKMKQHGVAGSTFSDWWAYKYEVNDAIPYNGAIMHKVGVLTAFNSDDAEMSRRLNQEAAKAVKYGGVSEEEAWKFVTLNPAKMLHIDNKVGSVKVGKMADLVLWNGHPMSIYSKAQKTMIEGTIYYDEEKDNQMRSSIAEEKQLLIKRMLEIKEKGHKTQSVKNTAKRDMHCETID